MAADVIALRRSVLDRLTACGIDVARALRHAGVPPSRFQASKAPLSTREFLAFWRAVEELASGPDIGLRLASEAQAHHLDVASLAALQSPNFGDALSKLARYKRLCLPEEMRIDTGGGEVKVGFHWLHADERLPVVLIDGALAHVLALARHGTGKPLTPLRVELARRRANEAMLGRYFRCEIRFDAPVDILVLDEAALRQPFRSRNAELYDVLIPDLEAALRERVGASTLVDDVKAVLQRSMSGQRPSVEKVAEGLHMSPRTLQRRLTELATSYQHLLDEVRNVTARRLLVDTDLEAAEIAFLLGFDEVNSFTRAFHTREGATPARWRLRHEDATKRTGFARTVPAATR